MHWRAEVSRTEDFYPEESLGMCNRDHKGQEESGQVHPGRVISPSCSCLSAESTPHNFSPFSALWRTLKWRSSSDYERFGGCPWSWEQSPPRQGCVPAPSAAQHLLQSQPISCRRWPTSSDLWLCSPSGTDVNLSQLSGISREPHHIYLTRIKAILEHLLLVTFFYFMKRAILN